MNTISSMCCTVSNLKYWQDISLLATELLGVYDLVMQSVIFTFWYIYTFKTKGRTSTLLPSFTPCHSHSRISLLPGAACLDVVIELTPTLPTRWSCILRTSGTRMSCPVEIVKGTRLLMDTACIKLKVAAVGKWSLEEKEFCVSLQQVMKVGGYSYPSISTFSTYILNTPFSFRSLSAT